jgi:hypothetical protein
MNNHHQALLVGLSYIIGFVTAFIMFGLTVDQGDKGQVKSSHVSDNNEAIVAESMDTELSETEEGLFFKKNGEERILSALTNDSVAETGFHVAIAAAVMSPDALYAHYCAQMDMSVDQCQHFVYSVDEDKTYMVKNAEGEMFTTAVDEAENVQWTATSELTMNGMTASGESMWVMQ